MNHFVIVFNMSGERIKAYWVSCHHTSSEIYSWADQVKVQMTQVLLTKIQGHFSLPFMERKSTMNEIWEK